MRVKLLFCMIILMFFIAGCSESIKEDTLNKINITNISIDNYFVKGRNVQCFSGVPKHVIVVGENETETLLDLGVDSNNITAVAQNNRNYAMKEENAKKFETIRKIKSKYLNMEYILNMNPDLIIAQQCVFIRNRLNNTDYWNSKGIKTLVPLNTNSPSKHLYDETVDTEMKFISDLGRVFNRDERAKEIINETYAEIDLINSVTKDLYKPHVMIVEFLSSMISYDKTKLVGNMVTNIGGVVSETPPVIGYEDIMKENPDVLFVVCSHMDYGKCIEKITNNEGLKNLKCVKTNNVYSIPLRFTYGTACRTKDGIDYLAERMYHRKFASNYKL